MIDNLSRVTDFYWSINNVWHLGGSAMVAGLLLKGSWFSSRRFFSSLTLPLPRFLRYPLVPGSARLKNPRWRSISERNGFSAMKPPVTACKQATRLAEQSVSTMLRWRSIFFFAPFSLLCFKRFLLFSVLQVFHKAFQPSFNIQVPGLLGNIDNQFSQRVDFLSPLPFLCSCVLEKIR